MRWENVQASLKRYFIVGFLILIVFGSNFVFSNGNTKFAEGSGEGETLFNSNCISCHSIGGGNGIGPDLINAATNRDKEWLTQMIKDPKALIDSGDEIANQLVKEYGMVMPTIELSDTEIASIVTYLETISAQGTESTQDRASSAGASEDTNTEFTTFAFALFGFIGAMLLFVIIGIVWRGRLREIRKSL